MLALVSRCSSDTFEWISGYASRRALPSPPLTFDGRPGRRPLIGYAVCLACISVASLRPGGRSDAPRTCAGRRPLTFGLPTLLFLNALRRFGLRVSGRTSPVPCPLRVHERSWRPSRDLPVLAAVFRNALRSRPTALHVAARVPLPEATAVFGPVFRPGPLLGRSPGSAPGPALCQGRWAPPTLLCTGFLPHRISLAFRNDLRNSPLSREGFKRNSSRERNISQIYEKL